ncbi:MAG TPA: PGPGW domain-containing protein [Candidatus Babeliales bacterium]|nr:PGPGW domain-containing protein [Candidatus Babeliales bacterium]
MNSIIKIARKTGVTVLGFLLIFIGIALLVLPGPGLIVIIIGLIVLSWEYEWAKHHLHRARNAHKKALAKIKSRRKA